MFRYQLIISLLTIFISITASAEDGSGIQMTAAIDTTIATIGDPVTLSLQFNYPEGTDFIFPAPEEKWGQFEVVGYNQGKPRKSGGEFYNDWHLTLAAFDTGRLAILPLDVKVRSGADTTRILSFSTDTFYVNVITLLPTDAKELKDIKPPFALRKFIPWEYLILLLIIAAIIFPWIVLYRRWKQNHPRVPFNETYLEPPHVTAIRKLNALKTRDTGTEDAKKTWISELSEIIREYLERRYFIRALEMSTREILMAYHELSAPAESMAALRQLLMSLDLVKFAKHIPDKSEIGSAWDEAYQFVDQTRHDNFLAAKSIL